MAQSECLDHHYVERQRATQYVRGMNLAILGAMAGDGLGAL